MKKNLISVIILALVLANLILTAILTFTIVPQTKKSNQLIDQVCSAINLELQSGEGVDNSAVPIEDIEVYNIADSFTINLKSNGDGKDHFALFSVGLSLNTQSEGYKDPGVEGLSAKETLIKDKINSIVQQYTLEEFREDNDAVKREILTALQDMFGSDFIVGVSFSGVQTQ